MGVSVSEKNSSRVGLPNILGKQEAKVPLMTHKKVTGKAVLENTNTEERQENTAVIKPDKKSKNSEKKVEEKLQSNPADKKEASQTPNRLNKRLGGMGIDAGSMKDAVFLRHEVVSQNSK